MSIVRYSAVHLMYAFDLDREPLKDTKPEDEKAALKDEIRNEEAGRENEPMMAESPKVKCKQGF